MRFIAALPTPDGTAFFPFTISKGVGDLGFRNGSVRPDLVDKTGLDNPSRKLWYNTLAYQPVTCQIPARPDLCHLGGGYNQLRGPSGGNLDASVYKNFNFRERYNIQFRWELFNITNTPWFGNPNGISFSNASQIVSNGSRSGEIRSTQTSMRRMQFALKFRI